MIVKITVGNVVSRIETPLPDIIVKPVSDVCSFKRQGAEHMALVKRNKWDGYKRLFKVRYQTFPTGLLHKVTNVLKSYGCDVDIHYNLKAQIYGEPLPISDVMERRLYQYSAAAQALAAKQSIIRIATGGGKTAVANIITAQLNTETLFLVHTKDLLRQAKEAYQEFLNIEVGQIGDGIVDVRRVTVGTIQTIARALGSKYEKDSYSEEDESDDTNISGRENTIKAFLSSVGLLLQDEAHRVASDTAYEVASKIDKAEYRVGFSASPWRDDGADLMIEAAYGHRSYEMSASELIDMGYLMAPIITVKKVRGNPWIQGTYDQVYKDWVVEDLKHNLVILDDATNLYNDNRITMILVKHIKHGEILSGMLNGANIPHAFLKGNDSSAVRADVIRDMRNRKLKCLIATTIADEGLDIRPLDGLILAGRGKSSVRALQRIGRALRIFDGKRNPIIYDYHDMSRFLEEHTMKRLQIYHTEPRFVIKMEG